MNLLSVLFLALFQSGSDGTVSTQELLDMAAPGAVVRVSGHGERLTIRKPVTLIGGGNLTPSSQLSITLDGPGSGNVSLVAITVQETLKGGGFDELRLERVLSAGDVNVDLEYLEATDSTFLGPVSAPGAVFVAQASGFHIQTNPQVTCSVFYGSGRFPLSVNAPERHEMPFDLLVSSPARPGGSVELVWWTPGPIGFLYMAEGSSRPQPRPGAAFGFDHLGGIDRASLVAVDRCSPIIPGRYTMAIPPGYDLIGRQFAFQVYDPPAYYSAPAFVTVR